MAGPGAGRPGGLGPGPDRSGAAGGAAPRRRGAPPRRGDASRASPGSAGGGRGAGRRGAAARASVGAARAGAVPGRPTGRRAAHPAPSRVRCSPPSWDSIPVPTSSPSSRRSCARTRRLLRRRWPPSPARPARTSGLVHYDVEDADLFFGRDADVAACVRRLADVGVVTVIGPSGSGKSSLVRAGIAAALRREGRRVVVVTPGAHPMDALTWSSTSGPRAGARRRPVRRGDDALPRRRRASPVLCRPRRARRARARWWWRCAPTGWVTFRRYPEFARLVERGLYLLGAMDDTELRAAIEGPAHQAGLLLEAGSRRPARRATSSASRERSPCCPTPLRQAWERREGQTLTVAGYRETGGIRGAVAQSAEEIYEQTPAEQRRDPARPAVAAGRAQPRRRTAYTRGYPGACSPRIRNTSELDRAPRRERGS